MYCYHDVDSTYGIVRADSDMINVIGGTGNLVAVYSCDEPLYPSFRFLLEVDFAVVVVIFRIDDKGSSISWSLLPRTREIPNRSSLGLEGCYGKCKFVM